MPSYFPIGLLTVHLYGIVIMLGVVADFPVRRNASVGLGNFSKGLAWLDYR